MNAATTTPEYLAQQAPRGLVVAAVAHWSIVTEGALLAGACIIIALLGQYFIRWRWEFTDDRFTTIFHLCLLTLLGAGVAIWSANGDALQTFLILFQWLPLIFTPLLAAQIYSTSQTVSLKTFFTALRLKERDDLRAGREPTPASRVALDFPFLVLVMSAASASNQKHWLFYAVSMALLSWAVWQRRSHRRTLPSMVALTLLVCALGYAGQMGLSHLQRVVENLPWLGAGDEYTNLKMSQTSIGSLRETKLKGKVLFRVKADQRNPMPTLLLETTYNRWASLGRWTASQYLRDLTGDKVKKDYSEVFHLQELPPSVLGRYPLRARKDYVATIMGSARSGRSVLLPLPPGARTLAGMPEMEVTTSFSGAVQVLPDRAAYGLQITYNPLGPRYQAPPSPEEGEAKLEKNFSALEEQGDQMLATKVEIDAIHKLAQDLGLAQLPDAEKAARIRSHFRTNYAYSLNSKHGGDYLKGSAHSPLVSFLQSNKVGHCEYFATATVLLLRSVGVPARYAVGYSVHEFSKLDQAYVVRSMHAHAWAQAYYDGAWHEVDSTPSAWLMEDRQTLSALQPIKDFFSAMWNRFNQWRSNGGADDVRRWAPWVVLGALLVVGVRTLFSKGAKRRRIESEVEEAILRLGQDSPFFPVMKELAALTRPPRPGETTLHWLERIRPLLAMERPALLPELDDLLAMHYRYRFDPNPPTEEELARLRDLSTRATALLAQKPEPAPAG